MKSCLITGTSTGIGEACAVRLDRAGWRVFAGVRREEDARRLQAELSSRATPLMLDVTNPASIADATRVIALAVGDEGLHGLVNNAGIAVAAPLELVPVDLFRRQLEVNVVGPLAVTQSVLPLIRKARGRVVLMGSIAGRMATPFLGPYSASKFALEALADAWRVELQPWGIHVSLVEPGSVATPIWGKGGEIGSRIREQTRPDDQARYAAAVAAIAKAAAGAATRGIPADVVARVVEQALTTATPKTRYLVGGDAKVRARLVALIPDRLRDTILTRAIGLPPAGDSGARG